ncbi:Hypothetical predicted protein [Olea europaea subsp. europaea]|uniref:Uncharacterized protein n=1 Tax=Olea europaea subsp. europaea TaxID=158383 RepID=A0A8S0TJF1_OLEEU|nr:Hypothetical predicted protein [Olea europaea subsp. europaea]
MPGKNSKVCHDCKNVGYFFGDCSIKRRCPHSMHGFQKFFKVEMDTPNKGKLFKCCNEKCGFGIGVKIEKLLVNLVTLATLAKRRNRKAKKNQDSKDGQANKGNKANQFQYFSCQ